MYQNILYTGRGKSTGTDTLGEKHWQYLAKLNVCMLYHPAIPLPGLYPTAALADVQLGLYVSIVKLTWFRLVKTGDNTNVQWQKSASVSCGTFGQ